MIEFEGPIAAWRAAEGALRAAGLSPVTIGSFALYQQVAIDPFFRVHTTDVDFGLAAPGDDAEETAATTCVNAGFTLSDVASGKWFSGTDPLLEMDLLTPISEADRGKSAVRPARPEFSMNLASVDLRELRSGLAGHPITVPGPAPLFLGKLRKLRGYESRAAWPGDSRDLAHAAKSVADIGLLLMDGSPAQLATDVRYCALAMSAVPHLAPGWAADAGDLFDRWFCVRTWEAYALLTREMGVGARVIGLIHERSLELRAMGRYGLPGNKVPRICEGL